jgi:translation initiation factor 2-alpha kinase 4
MLDGRAYGLPSDLPSVTRQELIGWLQQQIAEQKRVDLATAGAPRFSDTLPAHPLPTKEMPASSDVQLLLPVDIKKQRKQVKQLFLDRGAFLFIIGGKAFISATAFETGVEIKSAVQAGMPLLAVDVPTGAFDCMVKNPAWLTDDDAWKPLVALFPPQQSVYAQQVREAAVKRKTEGHAFLLLFAVRDERVQLLNLN